LSEKETARFVNVDGLNLRIKTSPDLGADTSKPVVVLFHGHSFSLDDWDKIGTYGELSSRSIPFIAVHLPKGKASKSQKREESEVSGYIPLLMELFKQVGIHPVLSKLIIVGPSMGGAFALAYALEKKDEVLGLVLIAPSLAGVNREALENLEVPVLLIWGEKDNMFPLDQHGRELKEMLPQAKLLIIKGARHPAYLDQPQQFHELLFDFIDELTS
jgi:abhydrolase domain-containing protein 14